MSDNNIGQTFYHDLAPKEVYKNFLLKYPVFKYIRFLFIGFFGFFFKMFIRMNRAMKEPDTGKINWKYTIILWSSIIFVLILIGIGLWLTMINL